MSSQTTGTPASPRPSRIRAAWRGEGTLAWAFWGFNFGGGMLLAVVGAFGFLFLIPFTLGEHRSVLESPVFRSYLLIVFLAYFAYVVAWVVMIWRCSFNVGWRGWGYVGRSVMFLWLLRLLFSIRTLVIGCSGSESVGPK